MQLSRGREWCDRNLGSAATLSCIDSDNPATSLLRGIDRLVIRVPSVPAAAAYYRDVLGLELLREGGGFCTVRLPDGKEILLHSDPHLPEEAVYLLVDDVRDVYRRREELRLRFSGPPSEGARGYRATVKDPFGTVLLLIDRTRESGAESTREPADAFRSPETLFAGVTPKLSVKPDVLVPLYEKAGRTADDLPYTPQFEQIFADYAAAFSEPQPDRAETWRHLLSLRKKAALPKLGAARSRPPQNDPETVALLRRVLDETFDGKIGRRDRLPYSEQFDAISTAFNRSRLRRGESPLAPHQLWRLVALLAK